MIYAHLDTDYNADTSKVSYILDEFKYYFETPYDPTEDMLSQCNLDRPGGASPDGRMYIVNHNLNIDILGIYIPAIGDASSTNSVSSILAHSDVCVGIYGRNPNVVLVSFSSKALLTRLVGNLLILDSLII